MRRYENVKRESGCIRSAWTLAFGARFLRPTRSRSRYRHGFQPGCSAQIPPCSVQDMQPLYRLLLTFRSVKYVSSKWLSWPCTSQPRLSNPLKNSLPHSNLQHWLERSTSTDPRNCESCEIPQLVKQIWSAPLAKTWLTRPANWRRYRPLLTPISGHITWTNT